MNSHILAGLFLLVFIVIVLGLNIFFERFLSRKPPRARCRYERIRSMTLIVLMLPAIALWGWDIIENWRARESVRLVYIIGLIGGLGTVGIQLYVMRQPHGEKEFRENYMADPTRCGRCGYNLTGNTSGVCPECGWTLTDTQG